jgi:hypothetical protein
VIIFYSEPESCSPFKYAWMSEREWGSSLAREWGSSLAREWGSSLAREWGSSLPLRRR